MRSPIPLDDSTRAPRCSKECLLCVCVPCCLLRVLVCLRGGGSRLRIYMGSSSSRDIREEYGMPVTFGPLSRGKPIDWENTDGFSAVQLARRAKKGHWELDENVKDCFVCGRGFTMLHRRHHCRVCGVIIGGCCTRKLRGQLACLLCFEIEFPRTKTKQGADVAQALQEEHKGLSQEGEDEEHKGNSQEEKKEEEQKGL
jgi:hypothetical protein